MDVRRTSVATSGDLYAILKQPPKSLHQVSDKLFNVRDSDVVRNLAPTFDLLQRIVQSDELRQRSNKVQIVVLTLTRILAAIRETDTVQVHVSRVLDLLHACAQQSLHYIACTDSASQQSPHAVVALEIFSFLAPYYADAHLVRECLPTLIELLCAAANARNAALLCSIASYLSQITRNEDCARELSNHAPQLLLCITQHQCYDLVRLLPPIYTYNPAPIHAHLRALTELLDQCTDRLEILKLCTLIAKRPTDAQLLIPHLWRIRNCLARAEASTSVIHLYLILATDAGLTESLHDEIASLCDLIRSTTTTTSNRLLAIKTACRIARTTQYGTHEVLPTLLELLSPTHNNNINSAVFNAALFEIETLASEWPQEVRPRLADVRAACAIRHSNRCDATLRRIIELCRDDNDTSAYLSLRNLSASSSGGRLNSLNNSRHSSQQQFVNQTVDVTLQRTPTATHSSQTRSASAAALVNRDRTHTDTTICATCGRPISVHLKTAQDGSRFSCTTQGTLPSVNEAQQTSLSESEEENSSERTPLSLTRHTPQSTRRSPVDALRKPIRVSANSINNSNSTNTSRQFAPNYATAKRGRNAPVLQKCQGSKAANAAKPVAEELTVPVLEQEHKSRVKGGSAAAKRQMTLEAFRSSKSDIETEPLLSERVTTFGTDDSVREENLLRPPSAAARSNVRSCIANTPKTSRYTKQSSVNQSTRSRAQSAIAQYNMQGQGSLRSNNDVVRQFCENHRTKIRTYIDTVQQKFAIPYECTVEDASGHATPSHKCRMRVHFACLASFSKDSPYDNSLCLRPPDDRDSYYSFKTRHATLWLHLMFLHLQAQQEGRMLGQEDNDVIKLKQCWSHIVGSKHKGTFSTLVTSAFPNAKDQDVLFEELLENSFYQWFTLDSTNLLWRCFACTHPDIVRDYNQRAKRFRDQTLIDGQLKVEKRRWWWFKHWQTKYFALSNNALIYGDGTLSRDKRAGSLRHSKEVDLRSIREVRTLSQRRRRRRSLSGTRQYRTSKSEAATLPRTFEIFTDTQPDPVVLKARDGEQSLQWVRQLQIAVRQARFSADN